MQISPKIYQKQASVVKINFFAQFVRCPSKYGFDGVKNPELKLS